MHKRNKLCHFILFMLLCFGLQAQEQIFPFQNWQFSKVGDTAWSSAIVPGTVHNDLYANKLIPDPFFGLNEYKLQWIEKEDWQYRCVFDVPSDIMNKKHLNIVFEGLDTYARVFLNDSLILIANNMFREWDAEIKPFLKEKNNRLLILFESAVNKGTQDSLNLSYKLPGGIRVFTRKAQYQYGWDWSPRFVTCGIWKPLHIEAWDDLKFENVQYVQDTVTKEKALLHAVISTFSDKEQECRIVIRNVGDNTFIAGSDFTLFPGKNSSVLYFQVDTPKLWWTNLLGEPYLYNFELSIYKGSSKIYSDSTKIGIRTLELVQQPDSAGKSFYFKLNGIPVFMKGANFVPADNFIPRITKEKYCELVNAARRSNMNMLRVWGGGIYEDDYFYDLCDENGILVWQDFMFACAMYPGDSAFIENVNEEAKGQITRLRNHPCIALWCGNNEISEGWYNWGWQKQYNYSQKDSLEIWTNYQNLFENILKNNVSFYDYGRPYWTSSPEYGWGRKESLLEGDSHYWGVWWGMEPFDMYEKKVGRFMSEYGFQSYPADETMRTYLDFKISDTTENPNPFWHNKHPLGFQIIDSYLLRDYYDTTNWRKAVKQYTYLSQLAQAYGIKEAIEAHRRAMPYCMGSLYWQFDDCWPGVSWSGTDYYGRKKALYWFVNKAFAPLLISVTERKDTMEVFIISELQDTIMAKLNLKLCDFYGKDLWKTDTNIVIQSNKSECFFRIAKKDLIKDSTMLNKTVFVATINNNPKSRALYYFKSPKALKLPRAKIKTSINNTSRKEEITLQSKTLAKNVFLLSDDSETSFSDNFFDLLPGESKTVYIYLSDQEKKLNKYKLKIFSYR
jgi:beta-mannosidase